MRMWSQHARAVMVCMVFYVVLVFLGALSYGAEKPEELSLPTGRVIERIACRSASGQTYALYLPRSYTPSRKWPILYLFDAGGNGVLAVKRFQKGAELYGFIVAGSN
ncbi:MAG: hypothetical protein ACUVWX_05940, partial [Kiritimatiellia bacterium]